MSDAMKAFSLVALRTLIVVAPALAFANSCTMPAYATADMRYAYAWRNAEFSLGVANLFDKRYFTQAFACAAGQPSSLYPEPGRAVTAGVKVSF